MELAARRAIKATSEKRLDRHQLLTVETSDAIARGPASPVSPGTPSPSAETVGEEEVRARYALGAVLGRGSYGVVFGGCDRRHTAAPEVAVKMLRRSNDRRDRSTAEVRILKQMQHRNVVRLFDVMQTEGKLYIVTELMACDLCAYVEDVEQRWRRLPRARPLGSLHRARSRARRRRRPAAPSSQLGGASRAGAAARPGANCRLPRDSLPAARQQRQVRPARRLAGSVPAARQQRQVRTAAR